MGDTSLIQALVDGLVIFATDALMPLMMFFFVLGVIFRSVIFYTVNRQEWFVKNFDKRVKNYLTSSQLETHGSFYVTLKKLLEKNYYELFVFRALMKRRNPDYIMAWSDRLFLIQQGCARVVKDTLQSIRYAKYGAHPQDHKETSIGIHQNNPCFNKAFGLFPIGLFNDILNILPGLFIVGGIFGTFLGIMKGLPELGGMDLGDMEASKRVMDNFLVKISYSMSTSIIGIILSVGLTIFNTIFNPEKLFIDLVNRFSKSLELVWDSCLHNQLPESLPEFNEHRDSVEVLAEEAVAQELAKYPQGVRLEKWSNSDKEGDVAQEVKAQALHRKGLEKPQEKKAS